MVETTTGGDRAVTLDAAGLLAWARLCVQRLAEHRDELNALNVFPVPDSDTGTNMLHTMRSALEQAEGEAAWITGGGGSPGAREIAVELGHGAVHGARGNSGVILSQVLRAVGEAATFTILDATTFRRALRTAVTLVDRALTDPIEGTIVSVLRAAHTGAAASSSNVLQEVVRVAADSAASALEKTPTQLAVLRQAGVVDSGGRGLLLLFDTLVEILTGTTPERPEYLPVVDPDDNDDRPIAPVEVDTQLLSDSRFEVMYGLWHTDEGRVDELRATLRTLGDSILVVGDGRKESSARWTVHVHTNDIGGAIEAGISAGRIAEVRVEDLGDGHGDGHGHGHGSPGAHGHDDQEGRHDGDADAVPNRTIVAVAPPGPVADLFTDSGAAVVRVDDNPDAMVSEFLASSAAELVVLPNGHLTRAQIVSIDAGIRDHGRHVLIVPTASVVQGLAALAVHDPTTSLSLDGFAMADAAGSTRHAHLQVAEQDALTLVGRCSAGDLLGIVGHDVAHIGTDRADSICALAAQLLAPGGELVTLLLGDGFDEQSADDVARRIEREHPEAEVVSYLVGGATVAWIGVE